LAVKLSVRNLTAGYGAVHVLHDVCIDVDEGETVALLGTNGNGKSTLMKCIMGLVRPSSGALTVEIDGTSLDLMTMSTEQIVDSGVAMVPEGRRLFARLTVEENLCLGAYRRSAREHMKQSIEWVFDVFPVLKARRKQISGSMSGGEQQMLAIGRALVSRPRLLLVDEPSVGLAPIYVTRVIDKIRELKSAVGLTVLMAEQNFAETMRIADRGYVLVHGKIAKSGPAQELNNSELIKKFYLGV
jgi:branched-chain amino acid transport system ATP-binding protein